VIRIHTELKGQHTYGHLAKATVVPAGVFPRRGDLEIESPDHVRQRSVKNRGTDGKFSVVQTTPVTIRASRTSGVAFLQFGSCYMGSRTRKQTTIERIFREVTGRRMPPSTMRILLRKWKAKRYSH
jgi:hypothetical protein